jgi:Trk-type K+ transport system membrane component
MKKKIEWALVFALIVSGIGFVCLYASIAIWLGAEVHI